jgi:hypothetical protein
MESALFKIDLDLPNMAINFQISISILEAHKLLVAEELFPT